MKKLILITLSLLLLACSLYAVGQQEAEEEGKELSGSVMVYTSMRRSVIDILKEGFEAANPGTTIDIYRSGTSEVLAKFQKNLSRLSS